MSDRAVCLCGQVALNADLLRRNFTACHCDMCRRWGGLWMAVECSNVRFEGEELLSTYNSSAWAERGFCAHCGTHLFYKVKREETYYIPVGLFDGVKNFTLKRQIYIDRKPDYYCLANETDNFTGAELTVADPPDE